MQNGTPIIFFDAVQTWAVSVSGIGHVALAAQLIEPGNSRKATQVLVAHLRFPMAILPAIKKTIENMELAAKPAGESRN
jgi:hypothetical protein